MTELVDIAIESGDFAALEPLPRHPTLDVIIPTRDRAHFLEACLASVRAQTRQPSNVWVVDDGSTDNTAELLAQLARDWPELRPIRSQARGASAARNTALELSTADLVAFLDSDDVWAPEMLEKLARLFAPARTSLAFVNCGLRHIDAQGNASPNAPQTMPRWRGWIFRKMLEDFYPMAPSTMMVRRDVAIGVGGFDQQLLRAQDRDFCLKIARNWEADAVPEVLVGLRQHQGNAYAGTKRRDPAFVLFQKLTIWNRWLDQMLDREAVLRRFRSDAAAAARHQLIRLKFGLYGRLRGSELELARLLFPTRFHLLRAMLPTRTQLKVWLGTHVITRRAALLHVAQRLGQFRGVSVDARARHRGP